MKDYLVTLLRSPIVITEQPIDIIWSQYLPERDAHVRPARDIATGYSATEAFRVELRNILYVHMN